MPWNQTKLNHEPGSNGIESILYILQIFRIGSMLSDAVYFANQDILVGGSYLSVCGYGLYMLTSTDKTGRNLSCHGKECDQGLRELLVYE